MKISALKSRLLIKKARPFSLLSAFRLKTNIIILLLDALESIIEANLRTTSSIFIITIIILLKS